jgi:hypothetical protein
LSESIDFVENGCYNILVKHEQMFGLICEELHTRKEKEMTYATALRHAGINLEKTDEYETYDFWGTTKSGKRFYMHKAGGAYGIKFTLNIDGKIVATACIFRTAIRLIKTN